MFIQPLQHPLKLDLVGQRNAIVPDQRDFRFKLAEFLQRIVIKMDQVKAPFLIKAYCAEIVISLKRKKQRGGPILHEPAALH